MQQSIAHKRFLQWISICLASLLIVPSAIAQDWSQWRGPQRDGALATFQSPATWPEQLKLKWKVTVGSGHSSPVVAGKRVFVLTRENEREVIAAYDLNSGQPVWRDSYTAEYVVQQAGNDHGKIPRATPIIHQGKLYTVGINGVVSCFEAQTGKLQWRKSVARAGPQAYPQFGYAASPLLAGNLLIVPSGGGTESGMMAFVAKTGQVKWKWQGQYKQPENGIGYASPILWSRGGETHLVMLTDLALVGLAPETGSKLWEFAFPLIWESTLTPLVAQQQLIVADQKEGMVAVRVEREGNEWKAKQAWRKPELAGYMSSPVVQGNLIFGLSVRRKGQFFCADATTGQTFWQTMGKEGDYAVFLVAGQNLLIQTTEGVLIIAQSNQTVFSPVRQYKIAESATWAHPALVNDGIVIKDANSLALWKLN